MTPEQVAQVLYQAGFRGEELVTMVAIGKRESGYNPSAKRTDNPGGSTGDFGLFQINYVNWPDVKTALGLSGGIEQLFNPLVNARAAKYLHSRGGFSPWNAAAGGFNANGSPTYATNVGAARTAVNNAASQGLLGQDYNSGGSMAPNGTGTPTADATGGPMTLPPDAVLYNNGTGIFAVFDVGGVKISYAVDFMGGTVTLDSSKINVVTGEQWTALQTVDGGDAEELRGMGTSWQSYKDFFMRIVDEVFGSNNPARSDTEVLRVLAEYAGRPDMSTAELTNKLQSTQWYQTRTSNELAWNSMSEAERQKRTDDTAAQLAQTWFQFTGEAITADDPRISNYLEEISSGKRTIGSWTEQIVKPQALTVDNSPWARTINDEKKAQLQPGIDVENTAQRVGDLARRWGIRWSDGTYQDWARKITGNQASEADVLEALKAQAEVLYPWKNRDTETMSAATPWIETYSRVMEKQADLFDPKVQAALTAGQPVWDFEQTLKKSTDWLGTRNAREDLVGVISETGRRMGFS